MIRKIVAYLPCMLFYWASDSISSLIQKVPDGHPHLDDFLFQFFLGTSLYSMWWDEFGQLNFWTDANKVD
jgi:hypothetical protein